MIQAVYDRNENKIAIKGHAYSGEPGHDLICASASMLVYTLAAAVGEEAITIEDVYEPYLMQLGFISRTPRQRTSISST